MTDAPALTGPAPELVFRLVGTWSRVDLSSPEAVADSARDVSRSLLGRSDEHAAGRARLRHDLIAAGTAAVEAQAKLLLIQTEIAPGEPMSATLTVFERDGMRMSPAIGTDPDTVLTVLEKSLALMDPARAATAVRRRSADSEVVRVHEIEETRETEGGETFTRRRLTAQYWYPTPDSKRLLLVVLSTPLGDIPNVLLSYFDAIVAASGLRPAAS